MLNALVISATSCIHHWSSLLRLVFTTGHALLADEAGLEERHRATETLTANFDDVAIWKISNLFIVVATFRYILQTSGFNEVDGHKIR